MNVTKLVAGLQVDTVCCKIYRTEMLLLFRRSVRIQDNELRDLAEKIRQANQLREREDCQIPVVGDDIHPSSEHFTSCCRNFSGITFSVDFDVSKRLKKLMSTVCACMCVTTPLIHL